MIKLFALTMLSALLLSTAQAGEYTQPYPFRLLAETRNSIIFVFTDPETECEYLTYIYKTRYREPPKNGGFPVLTPRLDNSGKPMCNVVMKPESSEFEKVE